MPQPRLTVLAFLETEAMLFESLVLLRNSSGAHVPNSDRYCWWSFEQVDLTFSVLIRFFGIRSALNKGNDADSR